MRLLSALGLSAAAVLACCSGVVADAVDYMSVSVKGVLADHVVVFGVVEAAFAPATPFAVVQQLYPTFSFGIDAGAAAGTQQAFNMTYTSSDPTILTSSLAIESGTVVIGTTWNSASLPQCVGNGQATMTVALIMINPVATTRTFAYSKECTAPLIQIGMTPFAKDVVADTYPVDGFQAWVVEDDVFNFYLYLSNVALVGAAPLQHPFSIFVESDTPAVVVVEPTMFYNASYTGAEAPESYILQEATQLIGQLTMPFKCFQVGGAQATITVTIDYFGASKLVFSFIKQCSARPKLPSLAIGTMYNVSDIYAGANGVSAAWAPPAGMNFGTEVDFYLLAMFLCVGCAGMPQPTFTGGIDYTVTYVQSTTDIYRLTLDGSPVGHVDLNGAGAIYAIYNCEKEGTSTTTFQIALGLGYETPEVAFTFQCVFPLLNIQYTSGSYLASVASKSVVTSGWTPDDSTIVIKSSEATSSFTIYLDSTSPGTILQQWYQIVFTVDSLVMDTPTVVDPDMQFASSDRSKPLVITWNCKATAAASTVTMAVKFGWGEKVMYVTYAKDCVAPSEKKKGSSWNAAGIFFFTLFIICLALFIGAWVYRHVKLEKRGWEAVPLYGSCVTCVDKCRGVDKPWSPQMTESTNGGSSSRSNYGNLDDNGYQSNL